MNEIEQRLAELERLGLSRRLRMVSGPQGPRVVLDGKPALLLCSNNYLGLADHPRVREAAAQAAMRWGVGAGASRLVSGTMTIHRRLEQRLAAFGRSEECVLFGSGYLANAGAIGALAGRGDVICSDELNHASIIDGCRLSRAQVLVYRHRDTDHLDWLMRRRGGNGRRLIVTDSVFSMDGDVAPLAEIVELAREHGARTIVDEAHAIGVLGPGGRGAIAQAELEGEVDIVIGTLGKALGSYGAYACAHEQTIRYLINTRASADLLDRPPAAGDRGRAGGAGAAGRATASRAAAALQRARAAPRARRRRHARAQDVEMHIVPLVVGEERTTMSLCEAALRRGVFAQAIRPPTVAPGTSRLRLAVMASHTADELRDAARAIGDAARELGLDLAGMGPRAAEPSRREDPELDAPAFARAALTTAPSVRAPTANGPFDGERDVVVHRAA